MADQGQRDQGMDREPFVLALDIGTSSTRALLFDATGSVVEGCMSQRSYAWTTSEDGEFTVDAGLLAQVVAETLDEVLARAGPRAARIAAVATDTFWHSLLVLDAGGHPLTPVISWADTRPRDAAATLRARLDSGAILQRTGAPLQATYWPAKLAWLAATQPDVFRHAAQFVSFADYLFLQFFGNTASSLSMASGTGLLRTREHIWDTELLAALGVRIEQLPALEDLSFMFAGLHAHERWPALAAVPWLLAVGDGAAANVGSGCAAPGGLALTIGTSAAIRAMVPLEQTPAVPQGLWCYLLDANRAVLGGALSEGGNVFAWLEHVLRIPPLAAAESEIAKLPPDGHGLTLLPYVAGERSLGWHAEARATIAGIHSGTTAEELLRAGVEALAYRLRAVYLRMIEGLRPATTPEVIGSGAALLNSPLLQQIVADTLGVPLYPSRDAEASARGAALLALETLGHIPDVATVAPHLEPPVLPDAARGAIYRRAAERQDDLYHRLLGASAV